MATLTELTAEIVSAHASGSSLTSEELLKNIQAVFNTLKTLEAGETASASETPAGEAPAAPAITSKQAFKNKDSVLCMICGKGFKTLKRHLAKAHDLKPSDYKKQFNLPSTQSLVAKNYSEQRKKDALDRDQGAILAKARAARAAKNAPAPEVKAKAAVPAPKKKAGPAKAEATTTPVKAKKAAVVKPAAKAKK